MYLHFLFRIIGLFSNFCGAFNVKFVPLPNKSDGIME